MKIIETIAPIAIEHLKQYFTDKETYFLIDYSKSDLKGQKFLTYLSNLDVPADIINPDYELIKEYFNTKSLVNIPALEKIAIDILFTYKRLQEVEKYNDFIRENLQIIQKWESILDSLVLYNVYTLNIDETKQHVESHPIDETDDTSGINFLSLLKHEDFFYYYNAVSQENLRFYKKYFNDYMFRGNNLFTYWANENNPMFLLTDGIASGTVNSKEYFEACEKDKELLENE